MTPEESADNRILITNDGDYWQVWEGSCSVNYYEPPEDAVEFETYDEADHYAQECAQGMLTLEGGVQILKDEEISKGLIEERDRLHLAKKHKVKTKILEINKRHNKRQERKTLILQNLLEICGDEENLHKWLSISQPFLMQKTPQEILDSDKDLELLEGIITSVQFGEFK